MTKNVTWNDVGDFIHGKNKNMIRRKAKQFNYIGYAHGGSCFYVECPFCNAEVKVYVWSFTARGKVCECGAMLAGYGEAYHFKEIELL